MSNELKKSGWHLSKIIKAVNEVNEVAEELGISKESAKFMYFYLQNYINLIKDLREKKLKALGKK